MVKKMSNYMNGNDLFVFISHLRDHFSYISDESQERRFL